MKTPASTSACGVCCGPFPSSWMHRSGWWRPRAQEAGSGGFQSMSAGLSRVGAGVLEGNVRLSLWSHGGRFRASEWAVLVPSTFLT